MGNQALVINAFKKKSTGEEIIMIVNILKPEMPIARISRAMISGDPPSIIIDQVARERENTGSQRK